MADSTAADWRILFSSATASLPLLAAKGNEEKKKLVKQSTTILVKAKKVNK
jgi:hypothetical protein